ncbi:MAG: hypothetical protein MI746_04115 [Pseudomonadales bacterium]|nr:hypothetical protein [Pseudomonadales bacterium]
MKKRLSHFVLVTCLLASTTSYGNWFSQFSAGVGNEDNVPRGLDSAHELSAGFAELGFSGGKLYQLGLYNTLTLSGGLSTRRYEDLSGFDSVGLSLGASLSHKFGFGAYAPRLDVSVTGSEQFVQGDARDVRSLAGRLTLQKRFTPGLMLGIGIDYEENDSPSLETGPELDAFLYDPNQRLPLEVFEYNSRAWFVEGEYAFENGLLLQAGFRNIEGGTVSSTSTPGPDLYKIARAFFRDPALDTQTPWFAYLLDADTDEWTAGLSWPLGIDASINLRGTWHDTDAFGGGNYKNSMVTLGYVLNF